MRSLKFRLFTAYGIVALAFIFMVTVLSTTTSSVSRAYNETVSEEGPQLQALGNTASSITRVMEYALETAYIQGVLSQNDPNWENSRDIAKLNEAIAQAERWVYVYLQLAQEHAEDDEASYALEIAESVAALHAMVRNLITTAHEEGEAEAYKQWHSEVKDSSDATMSLIEEVFVSELEELGEGQSEVAEVQRNAQRTAGVAIILTVLIALGMGIFTLLSINRPLKTMQSAAKRFGDGEMEYRVPEQAVEEFHELGLALNSMAEKVTESQLERDAVHRDLVDVSRTAGMAEVASGVLHNVGNVLNSVNIAVSRMDQTVCGSKVDSLSAVSEMLNKYSDDLVGFIESDQRGQKLPAFLTEISHHLGKTMNDLGEDLDGLATNIEHIKQIVAKQQAFAKVSTVNELLDLDSIVREAIELDKTSLTRHGVEITTQFEPVGSVKSDRHKLLQILVNLITNAKNAMNDVDPGSRQLKIGIHDNGVAIVIEVTDNGSGISAENLPMIFSHGFTTRIDGHGFGLHSSALNAKELGGSLHVESPGEGMGATFRLELLKANVQPNGIASSPKEISFAI